MQVEQHVVALGLCPGIVGAERRLWIRRCGPGDLRPPVSEIKARNRANMNQALDSEFDAGTRDHFGASDHRRLDLAICPAASAMRQINDYGRGSDCPLDIGGLPYVACDCHDVLVKELGRKV